MTSMETYLLIYGYTPKFIRRKWLRRKLGALIAQRQINAIKSQKYREAMSVIKQSETYWFMQQIFGEQTWVPNL